MGRFLNHGRDWAAIERFYARLVAGEACLSDIGLAPAGQPALGWALPAEEELTEPAPARANGDGGGGGRCGGTASAKSSGSKGARSQHAGKGGEPVATSAAAEQLAQQQGTEVSGNGAATSTATAAAAQSESLPTSAALPLPQQQGGGGGDGVGAAAVVAACAVAPYAAAAQGPNAKVEEPGLSRRKRRRLEQQQKIQRQRDMQQQEQQPQQQVEGQLEDHHHQQQQQQQGARASGKHDRGREQKPKGKSKFDRTTYKITVAYFGPRFEGWMQQPAPDASVEGELSRGLGPLLGGSRPALASGGRTDKGVSAAAQAVSFPSWHDLTDDQLRGAASAVAARAAGRRLGRTTAAAAAAAAAGCGGSEGLGKEMEGEGDVGQGSGELPAFRICRVQRVPRSFHATWSADWRRYVYLFPLREAAGQLPAPGADQASVSAAAGPTLPLAAGEEEDTQGGLSRCHEGGCAGCTGDFLTPEERHAVDTRDADPGAVAALMERLEGRPLDFHAFARDTPKGHPTTCKLYVARASVVRLPQGQARGREGGPGAAAVDPGCNGGGARALCIELVGDRFLRRMVRVLVSTALRESMPEAAVVTDDSGSISIGGGDGAQLCEAMTAVVHDGSNGAQDAQQQQQQQQQQQRLLFSPDALVKLCERRERVVTAVPAPALGLCFSAVGGREYFEDL